MNLYTNNATTALAAGLSSVATTLSVTTGGGFLFPTITAGNVFNVTLVNSGGGIEIVQVTARAGDVFTIVRAQGGTGAMAFVTGDKVELRITAANATGWENKANLSPLFLSFATPNHTTAQRETGIGFLGYNTTTNQFEGYGASGWGAIGGGATGGNNDASVYENDLLGTADYTIGQGAMVSGATISIATPAVVTLANTFVANQPVRFTTTGALPTGLATNGAYFVIGTGLTATSFQVSLIANGTAVATSGTQSGVHSAGKIKNAITGGLFTVNDGSTYTAPTGSTWSIT